MSNSEIQEIYKGVLFSDEELSFIGKKIKKIEFKKGAILIENNKKVTHQYFVAEGCLRSYFTDQKGKEYTLQFAIKDWWISDFTALFTGKKSIMTIEVLENAVLYQISRKDIEKLYVKYPRLETFFRQKLEHAFASFQKRILADLSKTAKEKYLLFQETYPNIEQCVKNYHIASYLGITSESLSRIRKSLTSKN
ncbi:Crp/Fnr family transcriptional regulator [Polaribacter tangerinus]|uniref:Crp/Fnr family transcriptional regulator n=1 Tax=Polaribacter tangerinus TaxID=1920034 RepID=UPI000B4B20FC|nr:Crp/Fnr family transcriptional regulator [Polaribacter tangerinus]